MGSVYVIAPTCSFPVTSLFRYIYIHVLYMHYKTVGLGCAELQCKRGARLKKGFYNKL